MGKIRVATLGDEKSEKEQKRKAEARRQTKDSKKSKVDEVSAVEVKEKPEESPVKQKKQKKVKVRSKNYVAKASLVDKTKLYSLSEAVGLVKQTSLTKFDGTVEIHLSLNTQAMGDKKDLRGNVTLPHGTGKVVRVVIADESIIAEIAENTFNFDILVAHPSMMPKLAKVARILGPKGLMPNPKTGTVSEDPEKRVKELSHGQVNFKTEPDQPLIHLSVGKVSFEDKKLIENVSAILSAIGKNKIVRATLTATMGPGVKLAIA